MSSSGAVIAKVFLDDNGNFKYDEGEEYLEGVNLKDQTRWVRKSLPTKMVLPLYQ